jgi:hypothetical protein
MLQVLLQPIRGAAMRNCLKATLSHARSVLLLTLLLVGVRPAHAVVFDGGVDSANLGKGEWIYVLSYAVNHFSDPSRSPVAPGVTDVPSMMSYMKNTLHVQFVVVKAGTGSTYYPSQGSPQFTSSLVNAAHAQNLKIFGYTLSTGTDVPGEIALASYVNNCGADGFILDAEGEWEGLPNKQTLAWQLCGGIKTNWPNKFLGHSPFANYNSHSAFPYKEFGYWCDTVMPQCYWVSWSKNASPSVNQYRTPALGIQWMDSNFLTFQSGLSSQGQTPPTYKHPSGASWTNAIKPLAPIAEADQPGATNQTYADMTNFVNYLKIDPTCVTAGGYKGCVFFRVGLQDEQMLEGIAVTRIGTFNTSPSIITQPIGATNNAGTTVTFSVAAAGSAPFTYSWWKGGSPVFDGPNVAGATTATLTRSSVLGGDAGTYTVLVGNDFGSEFSDAATFAVIDPSITAQPSNQTVAAGDTATFTIAASGTTPLAYRWQKNGADLSNSANTSGATNSSLTLENLQQIDEANYRVVLSNPFGTVTSTVVTLTVTGPPKITSQPQSQTILSGSNFSLNVGVAGVAPLSYQWYFAAQPILNANNATLSLSNVQPSAAGNYFVTITNSLGTTTSSNAVVAVNYGITFNIVGGGSVSPTPNDASYPPGSSVVLNAIPNAGCSFLNWSGDAAGSANPLTVPMNTHKTITAVFSAVTPVEDIVVIESRSGGSNYSAYSDTQFFDSTLKSTAADCTASIGSRYATTNTSSITLTPTLANAGKTYVLQVTHGLASTLSSGIMVDAAVQGGNFALIDGTFTNHLWTSAFQQSSPNTWKTIGKLVLNPGITHPTITFTSTNKNLSTTSRFASDGYRLAFNTVTTLNVSSNRLKTGHPTTFIATVTAANGLPSGTVTLYNPLNNANYGSAILNASGVAIFTLTNRFTVSSAPFTFAASYAGNANFSPSTSDRVDLDVDFDIPAVVLHSDRNPSASTSPVTITATVTGSGIFTPTGDVDFYDGGNLLENVMLDKWGVATLVTTNLSVADSPYSIIAYYNMDAWDDGFDSGTSAPLFQTIMDPPLISTDPVSLTKIGGAAASFTVAATGTPPLSYRWYKNRIEPLAGTNDVFTLPSVRRNDSAGYSVVVSNLVGTAVSSDAFLDVHVPQHLGSPTLLPDGSLSLTTTDADGGLLSASDLQKLEVQVSTNLLEWTPLPGALTLTNGAIFMQTPALTNDGPRFYRIVESW